MQKIIEYFLIHKLSKPRGTTQVNQCIQLYQTFFPISQELPRVLRFTDSFHNTCCFLQILFFAFLFLSVFKIQNKLKR